jgi:diacylglycerol kinase (ATP)
MNVAIENRPLLGIVPVGSGNDFAHTMGIKMNPESALRQVFTGSPRPIDVGCVQDGATRKEFWMNTLGMGFDAAVNIHSRNVPLFQGFMIYFLAVFRTMIQNYRPFNIHYNIDGIETDSKTLMFTIANGKREGGGFLIAPDAKQDDGLLDFTYVDVITRLQMLSAISYFLKGTHAELPYVHTGTCQKVTIQSDIPLWIHTDGEIFSGFSSQITSLSIEILPKAIQLIS